MNMGGKVTQFFILKVVVVQNIHVVISLNVEKRTIHNYLKLLGPELY